LAGERDGDGPREEEGAVAQVPGFREEEEPQEFLFALLRCSICFSETPRRCNCRKMIPDHIFGMMQSSNILTVSQILRPICSASTDPRCPEPSLSYHRRSLRKRAA